MNDSSVVQASSSSKKRKAESKKDSSKKTKKSKHLTDEKGDDPVHPEEKEKVQSEEGRRWDKDRQEELDAEASGDPKKRIGYPNVPPEAQFDTSNFPGNDLEFLTSEIKRRVFGNQNVNTIPEMISKLNQGALEVRWEDPSKRPPRFQSTAGNTEEVARAPRKFIAEQGKTANNVMVLLPFGRVTKFEVKLPDGKTRGENQIKAILDLTPVSHPHATPPPDAKLADQAPHRNPNLLRMLTDFLDPLIIKHIGPALVNKGELRNAVRSCRRHNPDCTSKEAAVEAKNLNQLRDFRFYIREKTDADANGMDADEDGQFANGLVFMDLTAKLFYPVQTDPKTGAPKACTKKVILDNKALLNLYNSRGLEFNHVPIYKWANERWIQDSPMNLLNPLPGQEASIKKGDVCSFYGHFKWNDLPSAPGGAGGKCVFTISKIFKLPHTMRVDNEQDAMYYDMPALAEAGIDLADDPEAVRRQEELAQQATQRLEEGDQASEGTQDSRLLEFATETVEA